MLNHTKTLLTRQLVWYIHTHLWPIQHKSTSSSDKEAHCSRRKHFLNINLDWNWEALPRSIQHKG
jgi:hypothetical protein